MFLYSWEVSQCLNVSQCWVEKKNRFRWMLVELHLIINGQYVPPKGYCNFRIEPNHVLVCDLQLLFNDEEWLNLDALLLRHEWNQVQISYEALSSTVTLSKWGVFVYKQRTTNLEEHVQLTCFNYITLQKFTPLTDLSSSTTNKVAAKMKNLETNQHATIFFQWNPGGWSLVHWRIQHAWEALYQNENSGSSSSEVEENDAEGFY